MGVLRFELFGYTETRSHFWPKIGFFQKVRKSRGWCNMVGLAGSVFWVGIGWGLLLFFLLFGLSSSFGSGCVGWLGRSGVGLCFGGQLTVEGRCKDNWLGIYNYNKMFYLNILLELTTT